MRNSLALLEEQIYKELTISPEGWQGQRGPPGQSSSSTTNIIDLDDVFIDLEVYWFLSRIGWYK